ncbi:MAG: hypothetical protein AB1696_20035 [Planctomycetota bacterium]
MAKKKSIDAVALMRRIRDKMSREIAGMSYGEQKRYLRNRSRVGQSPASSKRTA